MALEKSTERVEKGDQNSQLSNLDIENLYNNMSSLTSPDSSVAANGFGIDDDGKTVAG